MQIVQKIPSDRKKYLAWLQAERKQAEKWETCWDHNMAVEPNNTAPWKHCDIVEVPTWFTPLKDIMIEWVYVIDLDRELFTVNNGAHFRLDQVSKINWPKALGEARLEDTIALPARLPDGAIVGLVAADYAADATGTTALGLQEPKRVGSVVLSPDTVSER